MKLPAGGRAALLALALAFGLAAAARPAAAQRDEVARDFSPVTSAFDHERHEVMIPMRDGVRLHTVIVIPRALAGPAPIILTRTPYGADKATEQGTSPRAAMVLPMADETLLEAGYIRVYQDIRGRYDSEGEWVMTLPPRGPLNRGRTDEGTDTWDTIEWLVDNLAEDNGRVGLTGVSYPGWLTLMGLLEPHPALKAAVPMYPMVDGWIGDDFYHNGALRQTMFEWIYNMATSRDGDHSPPFGWRDMYEAYLDAGSADAVARRYNAHGLRTWRKIVDNPAYSDFWSGQAVQDMLRDTPPRVPTLIVHGLFDQEDNFGGIAAYQALEARDVNNDMVYLAVGPWNHGQSQREASSLGPIAWHSDTGRWFRENPLLAFWNQHLKGEAPSRPLAPVLAFETGANAWRSYPSWPAPGAVATPLYLAPQGRVAFSAPAAAGSGFAEYVSDPARPVPYRVRPVLAMYDGGSSWNRWLVDDQRPFSDRTDVLTFVSEPLAEPLTIAGGITANLFASTTGTDADWVVKLIDVYPPEVRENPELGGYQLMVSGDIMRGRYRESPSRPQAIAPNSPAAYRVRLPHANHTFRRGHRIMVQIQSSWFPLYDRNPQTYVANIAQANPADYRPATQRIWFAPGRQSFIELPVVGPAAR
ncbi:MAG TPA: CocE/NonD family hydrolase [Allosphingosinicella sp.]|nr:CocE/NonD family hydrolase [Allosphingosinicella sp.]